MTFIWPRSYCVVAGCGMLMSTSALFLSLPPAAVSNVCGKSRSAVWASNNQEDWMDSVTDAEALLACRAYLQRKNRLGAWKDYQRRKQSLETLSAGYFWEDPDELVYLNKDDQEDEEDVNADEYSQIVFENYDSEGSVTMQMGSTQTALERGAEFTSFPVMPSEERVRRSKASKRKWDDPKWKAKWYEKRWGKRHSRKSPLAAKQKKLDDRIRSLPSEVYPELAALSGDEIQEAVRTFVVGNQRRSVAHTKRVQEARKKKKDDKPSKIDLMFASDETLKEAQRKRSERATKAYQTRLKNQPTTRRKKQRIVTDVIPAAETPRAALARIEAQLEIDELPSISDIQLILKPPKLSHRKDLLRRILAEHFDLRGKCIPVDPSNKDSKMMFVTTCTISELGAFVVRVVREKQQQADAASNKEVPDDPS